MSGSEIRAGTGGPSSSLWPVGRAAASIGVLNSMQRHAKAISRKLSSKILDEMRFFRSWVGNPLKTGAVSPSGPALTRRMAALAEPERNGPIVELGPGTGVVTKALIDRGIDPGRLILVEYNREFCALLRRRFPGVTVVQGDAYALVNALGDTDTPLASVVSSLPLFTRPVEARRRFVMDAMAQLEPGAPLIQFSYALVAPVAAPLCDCTLDRTNWIVSNLPPARVWTYRRPVAAAKAD